MTLKMFTLIICSFAIKAVYAENLTSSPNGCGEYKIAGVLRKDRLAQKILLIVNEKSKSERRFQISDDQLPKIMFQLDRPILIEGRILKLDGTQGVLTSIGAITDRVPNPLNPSIDTGFIFLKKIECLNE